MAAVATLSKGYDLEYIWKQVDCGPVKDAAGYYTQASETRVEPPGRWWGPGANQIAEHNGESVRPVFAPRGWSRFRPGIRGLWPATVRRGVVSESAQGAFYRLRRGARWPAADPQPSGMPVTLLLPAVKLLLPPVRLGLRITRLDREFTSFTPFRTSPHLSPADGSPALWLPPGASHPTAQTLRSACRKRGRVLSTHPELIVDHLTLHSVSSPKRATSWRNASGRP